jgi:nucleoside-diphosphate-sugar epimerase
MSTYFVTGGNGFLGSHLVDRLVSEGHSVRALVRNPRSLRFLDPEPVDLVPGDLHDPDALARGAAGADVVVHGAALTRAPTESEMMRVNLDGTRNVLTACLACETPPTLVFVSSQAAGGPSRDGHPVTEETPPRPRSSYGRSKLAAEEHLLAHAGELPVAVVRPPAIYGPRDDAFLFLFRQASRGMLTQPGRSSRLSIAHVDDVVTGLRAAERGRGIYYVTDGVDHTNRDILEAIAAAVGVDARIVSIPSPLFVGAIWIWEKLARLGGTHPPITTDRAQDAVARDWISSDRRAREELGYASRWTLTDGMRDTARWYRAEGWLS